mmetsp:Transcript_158806/g.509078  ORF Transcript_158806/g.509078 Transcript_158806/m.509078 type:complete len:305 (-) Transcript_158806:46-960(-)
MLVQPDSCSIFHAELGSIQAQSRLPPLGRSGLRDCGRSRQVEEVRTHGRQGFQLALLPLVLREARKHLLEVWHLGKCGRLGSGRPRHFRRAGRQLWLLSFKCSIGPHPAVFALGMRGTNRSRDIGVAGSAAGGPQICIVHPSHQRLASNRQADPTSDGARTSNPRVPKPVASQLLARDGRAQRQPLLLLCRGQLLTCPDNDATLFPTADYLPLFSSRGVVGQRSILPQHMRGAPLRRSHGSSRGGGGGLGGKSAHLGHNLLQTWGGAAVCLLCCHHLLQSSHSRSLSFKLCGIRPSGGSRHLAG